MSGSPLAFFHNPLAFLDCTAVPTARITDTTNNYNNAPFVRMSPGLVWVPEDGDGTILRVHSVSADTTAPFPAPVQ